MAFFIGCFFLFSCTAKMDEQALPATSEANPSCSLVNTMDNENIFVGARRAVPVASGHSTLCPYNGCKLLYFRSKPVPQTDINKADWEVRWEETLRKARGEGRLVIYSTLSAVERDGLSKGFKNRYGISIEWLLGRPAEIEERLFRERRANLYYADLFNIGNSNSIRSFKPAGFLDSLDAELILPEVLDVSKWEGNKLPWVDKEHMIIAPSLTPSSSVVINSDLVTREEIKSYRDILKPKFKGKITMETPTRPGSTQRWVTTVGEVIMSWDFIRQLAQQEPVLFQDARLPIEWLVNGKDDNIFFITLPVQTGI